MMIMGTVTLEIQTFLFKCLSFLYFLSNFIHVCATFGTAEHNRLHAGLLEYIILLVQILSKKTTNIKKEMENSAGGEEFKYKKNDNNRVIPEKKV